MMAGDLTKEKKPPELIEKKQQQHKISQQRKMIAFEHKIGFSWASYWPRKKGKDDRKQNNQLSDAISSASLRQVIDGYGGLGSEYSHLFFKEKQKNLYFHA